MSLQIRTFVAPGFGENGYIVWEDGERDAVAIDPGNAVAPMLKLLREERLGLAAVLLTHAHLDHLEGVARLVERTSAPVHLHPADRFLYDNAGQQARQFGLEVDAPPAISASLADGQTLELCGLTCQVRHVPGHSPGHVLFHMPDAGCAFVGDVVFQGSIGRTDLPGGDFAQLMESIREQVLDLPDDTTLYPGHGPPTTVGHERATNPFLVPHYGGGLA
jgi:glyoxylase-like metal-dependent hydrolase (beta-lactamase superfamily II)